MSSDFLSLQALNHSSRHKSTWKPSSRTQIHWMRFASFYEIFMYITMLVGPAFVWLQGGAILHNKSADNVAIPSFIILIIWSLAVLVWIRLHTSRMTTKHWIVMTSLFLIFLGSVFTLVAALMYRPAHSPGAFISL